MAAEASPIRVGTRFRALNVEYEIAFVEGDKVRFSTVASGTTQTRLISELEESIKQHDIEVTFQAMARTRLTPRSHALRSSKERESALRRMAYLQPIFDEFGWIWPVETVTKEIAKIAALRSEQPPHYATVVRWRDLAKRSWKLTNLAPDHYLQGNGSRFTEAAWDYVDHLIAKHWLVRTRPSIADAWQIALGEMASNPTSLALFPKRKPPGLRTIQRRVATYDPIRVCRAREGKAAAARMAKAAGRSMEPEGLLDVVVADGQLLDVLIIPTDADNQPWAAAGIRPYITIMLDWRTRYPISMLGTFAPYSTCTVLAALRDAVVRDGEEPKGKMRRLLVDNGPDYISDGLKYAASEIGFDLEWAGPSQPDVKAVVERFIGNLTRYIHSIPGTVFSSPIQRGDYPSEVLACITMEKLLSYIKDFKNIYVKRPNAGTGRAPLRLWRELALDYPPIVFEANEVEHATRVPVARQVTDGRVRVHNLFWYSHALKTWEIQRKQSGHEAWVDVLVSETALQSVIVRTRAANPDALTKSSQKPRSDARPQLFQADSTKPRYTTGLTLFEHMRTWEYLKKKGIEDLEALDDYELEKARYQMKLALEQAAKKSRRSLKSLARMQDLSRLGGRETGAKPTSAPIPQPPSTTASPVLPLFATGEATPADPTPQVRADDRIAAANSKIANIFGGARKPVPVASQKKASNG